MRNLPLLDIPFNIFKLEVFDILLSLTIPAPLLTLGAILHPIFFLPYPFLVVGISVKIRNMKKDKAFGYTQRFVYSKGMLIKEKLLGDQRKLYP